MGDAPMHGNDKGEALKRTRSRANSAESSTIEDNARARALVRRTDMLHRASSVRPDESEEATEISATHAGTRKTQPRPRLVAVGLYDLVPRGLTRERLLAYNASTPCWQPYADAAAAKPKEVCLLLAIVLGWRTLLCPTVGQGDLQLGWRYKSEEAGQKSILLTDAIHSVYQCTGVAVTAPQADTIEKRGHPRINGPPHAFMVSGMSPEDGKLATARYGHCMRFDNGEIFAWTMVYWDMAPPIHVTTLVGVDGLGEQTPALEGELLGYVQAHVTKRSKIVSQFLQGNSDYFWGDAGLDPDWLKLLLDSLKVTMLVGEADNAKGRNRTVQLNVYAIGAFTDVWTRIGWTDALLGDKVPLGRYGFATPIKKPHECSYCFDSDHHRRLCPILRYPGWIHQPAVQDPSTSGGSGGANSGKGKGPKKGKHAD
ncbi:hypothetical protein AURDEDRAFT_159196 [Auricularia subglabra TFB-10046 SS5]|nr:hypothetical protein AURDEDRAFT_159196 [Auricularia subglabra TFB-10046 SS5]